MSVLKPQLTSLLTTTGFLKNPWDLTLLSSLSLVGEKGEALQSGTVYPVRLRALTLGVLVLGVNFLSVPQYTVLHTQGNYSGICLLRYINVVK